MTTKTGDITKRQIMADAGIDNIQWNRNLNFHAKKAIKTANEFVPTTGGDWSNAPTTVDAALDELGSRSAVGAETSTANVFTENQSLANAKSLKLMELTANGVNYVAVKAPDSLGGDYTLTLPAASDTLATLASAQVFESKSLEATCAMVDTTDNTKTLKWNLAAQTAGVDITITTGAEAADRVLNIPVLGGDRTLDFIDLTQTVSAVKTFSAANIHYNTMTIVDAAATPKAIGFSTSGATASTKITLAAAQASNITVNLPTAAGTIALTSDIGAAVFAVAEVALTQAEITGLYATSKALVAAPVAGHILIVDAVEVLHSYAIAAYGNGGDVVVQYDSTVNGLGVAACPIAVANVTAGASSNTRTEPAVKSEFDMVINKVKGLYLSNKTQAFNAGDATNVIKVRVYYRDIILVA